ncbi:MAG: oligopeptidase B [Gammaproteobacteria bacterium]|nr:oligopeptidase B [Gammaproteobacteria bacterium]
MKLLAFLIAALLVLLSACDKPEPGHRAAISPPIANQVDTWIGSGDQRRLDEYYWIRDDSRTDPQVLGLLEAENDYTAQVLAHTEKLQQTLFEEITGRLTDSDMSVPVRNGPFFYVRRFNKGGEYPVYVRYPVAEPEAKQLLLDANSLSQGHDFYQLGNWKVSPNHQQVAYAEDTLSRRLFRVKIRDIADQRDLVDTITGAATSLAWSADGHYLFYVRKHPQTLREHEVYRHAVGTSSDQDVLIYTEQDTAFSVSVSESRSKAFILIRHESTDSTEVSVIPAGQPEAEIETLLGREEKHEYRARHHDGYFYLLTNWQASNFRLMRVVEDQLNSKQSWQEIIPARDDVLISDFEIFDEFIVVEERAQGLSRLKIRFFDDRVDISIPVSASPYTIALSSNPESASDRVRYQFSSLITPDSVFEFDVHTQQSILLKQDKIVGNYDPALYQSSRFEFSARDGVKVPVSMVYRQGLYRAGQNPAYLYAYGAYGYSSSPYFRKSILSLIDRGFVFAIIHVRGGQELGRTWYDQGRLLNKKNTFNDFIDGTRFLADNEFIDVDRAFASGGSAGGLLMGVIANQAPQLYRGIIARVPFVDVVTTMLDGSIPLTNLEFSEWGDPSNRADYDYMLSYSPYDQVKPQGYTNMLVTTGLFDSQVQYFEPVKWVSRLRRLKTDENQLLLDIDMTSGHGGSSGRYQRYRKTALEYAFILDLTDKEINPWN